MPSGPNSAAQLGVQRLDGICGVDDPPHAFWEGEERNHELPVAAPALCNGRILYAPWTLREGLERSLPSGGIGCAIDRPQRLRHALAILPGGKIHRMSDQVDDTGLNHGLRKHRIDGLGKALQSIDHRNENVLGAAGLELVDDAQPEFGAFGLFYPDAENLLGAVRQDAERDVDRLVAHEAFIADL